MPRISRLIVPDQKCVYHVMSRTALEGFPFGDVEKEEMVKILKRYSSLYLSEIIGFCIMGNHFHLLVRMIPDNYFTDNEIKERYIRFLRMAICFQVNSYQITLNVLFCFQLETDRFLFFPLPE